MVGPLSEFGPFSVLTGRELSDLSKAAKARSFKTGERLFRSGQPVNGIFFLQSGVVKITQPHNGKDVTVRLAAGGDLVGHRSVFTSETYKGSAVVKVPVRALAVPTEFLLKLFGENKEFAHQMIRLVAGDLEKSERLLLEYQKLNVPSRLISLFRTLDQKVGVEHDRGRLLATKLSKVEIAEMIGASQEVVSRQLSKWKKENLLFESDKQICLSNRLLKRVIR